MGRVKTWIHTMTAGNLVGPALLVGACAANIRAETSHEVGVCPAYNLASKVGSCDVPSGHVVPFAPSGMAAEVCSPAEMEAIGSMDRCLCELEICEAGLERSWTSRLESCVELAGSVCDACLGTFVGPPVNRGIEVSGNRRER
jgi:hypothetical protein